MCLADENTTPCAKLSRMIGVVATSHATVNSANRLASRRSISLLVAFSMPYLPFTLMILVNGLSTAWSIVPSYTVYRTPCSSTALPSSRGTLKTSGSSAKIVVSANGTASGHLIARIAVDRRVLLVAFSMPYLPFTLMILVNGLSTAWSRSGR
jgi:hypothetical protein